MKKIRYIFIAIVGLFFYSMILSTGVRNIYLSSDEGERRLGFIAKPLKFLAETPLLLKQFLEPAEFLVENTKSEDGFSYVKKSGPNTYSKLLVSYKTDKFESKFDLLDINTGDRIKHWSPENKSIFEKAYNELNPRKPPSKSSDLYFMHPLMTKDSSLVFTSQLSSLLAKIDKNSNLLWLKNDKTYHHSLEKDNKGILYSCTRPFQAAKYDFLPDTYEDYKNTLLDDHITLIKSDNGEEIFDKSIIQILLDNGYEELLLGKGQVTSDLIHLNDIQPALSDSEYWQKGDLLVSCRNLSAVFLYRPTTNKILWIKIGPWYNQHDADFYGEDKIVVFGNDLIREESKMDPRITTSDLFFSKSRAHNEVYVYSFANDSISTPYTKLLNDENVRTVTSGRCDILPNGDLYVEDTNHGKIIIGDSTTKKIEYVKRLDENYISSLFWSRIIN